MLAALVVSTCACSTGRWVKPGASELEAARDDYLCLRDSRLPVPNIPPAMPLIVPPGGGFWGGFGAGLNQGMAQGAALGALVRQQNLETELYERCLKARGWRWETSSDPVTASRPEAPAANPLTGTYLGNIRGVASGRGLATELGFRLIQNGGEVAGIWATTNGATGTFTGKLTTPATLAIKATQADPCPGDFEVSAEVAESEARVLRGVYSGTDCAGELNATFVVTRQ